jgi:hypothetical protein
LAAAAFVATITRMTPSLTALALAAALLCGCGSVAPASGDLASAGDAGGGTACEDYCTCMTSTCPTVFSTVSACLTDCAMQSAADLTCRTVHCTLAKMAASASDLALHCGHAHGVSLCPPS